MWILENLPSTGIGNYLRAEILHRANVSPFAIARDVFQSSTTGSLILNLCKSIPQEVLDLGNTTVYLDER